MEISNRIPSRDHVHMSYQFCLTCWLNRTDGQDEAAVVTQDVVWMPSAKLGTRIDTLGSGFFLFRIGAITEGTIFHLLERHIHSSTDIGP